MSKKQKKTTSCSIPNLHYIGIDVSKDTLDLYHEISGKGFHCVIANKKASIEGFCETLGTKYPEQSVQFVLEATGTYSDVVIHTLTGQNLAFSVISPEKSRGFMNSENLTNITDKQCAKMLCKFGSQKKPPTYQMPTEAEMHLKQLISTLDDLKKDLRRIENQQHAQLQLVNCSPQIVAIREAQISETKKHIQSIEAEINKLSQANFEAMITNIETIACVGKTTATAIVIATQGLQNCDSAKSLAKFIGLCPNQGDSGTSVRKQSHIPKSGITSIKNLLFNCARSALRCNPLLKAFFDKLVKNGKNGKVALTAVMHKLVRIIFGVAKSGIEYDPNFSFAKNI